MNTTARFLFELAYSNFVSQYVSQNATITPQNALVCKIWDLQERNRYVNNNSNTIPLTTRVVQLRGPMFGHVLQMPEETPAQKSTEFAVIGSNNYRAWKDRFLHKSG